jgi:hypothetical protein
MRALRSGWARLWSRQRVVWGLFALNLAAGALAAMVLAAEIAPVLDHSLYALRLYHGFDVAALVGLLFRPGVSLTPPSEATAVASVSFLLVVLFFNGGILENYQSEQPLETGEFFGACGHFFGRFVRLTLWALVLFAPLLAGFVALHKWTDKLAGESTQPFLGFWIEVAGAILLGFLAICVRLWLDMTQVLIGAEDRRGVARALVHAFRLTFGRAEAGGQTGVGIRSNFVPLFSLFFLPLLLSRLSMIVAIWIWVKLPAESILATWLLGETVVFVLIVTRLWQRAAEVAWFKTRIVVSPPLLPTSPHEHADFATQAAPDGVAPFAREANGRAEVPSSTFDDSGSGAVSSSVATDATDSRSNRAAKEVDREAVTQKPQNPHDNSCN